MARIAAIAVQNFPSDLFLIVPDGNSDQCGEEVGTDQNRIGACWFNVNPSDLCQDGDAGIWVFSPLEDFLLAVGFPIKGS